MLIFFFSFQEISKLGTKGQLETSVNILQRDNICMYCGIHMAIH